MFQEIIEKISRYNVFNHLLPGAIFSIWVTEFTEFNMVRSDILSKLFLYYFVGVVLSRIGSVLIEPVLKYVQFVKHEPYEKYLLAAKNDQKIETLVEANNSYRTSLSVFLCALFLKLYLVLKAKWQLTDQIDGLLLLAFLITLFLFSYRKQTQYIASRIKEKSDV